MFAPIVISITVPPLQKYRYNKGYIWIGAFFCIAPGVIILLLELDKKAAIKESARRKDKIADGAHGVDTPILRNADEGKRGRILLSASVQEFCIVYRRVRFVNELVVNGKVYDERKAVMETSHNLFASIGGHIIEAGFDSDSSGSYIRFDDQTIAEKQRVL